MRSRLMQSHLFRRFDTLSGMVSFNGLLDVRDKNAYSLSHSTLAYNCQGQIQESAQGEGGAVGSGGMHPDIHIQWSRKMFGIGGAEFFR